VTAARRSLPALAATIVVVAGCRPVRDDGPAEAGPVEHRSEMGPVALIVRADRRSIAVGDPLTLTIEVDAEPGIEVRMPGHGESLGPFTVRSVQSRPDIPDAAGARRRWTDTIVLDTFDSGDLEIPAITVPFSDRRNEATTGTVESEISAQPLVVTVRTMIEGDFDPASVRDIKGAAEVPVPGRWRWLWWAAGLAAAVSVAALAVARRLRTAARAPQPVVPAHVWALAELDRLAADALVERGEVHNFYSRLSDIVRRYIERRFGLMAPERTTEEFLRELQGGSDLHDDQQALLAVFLRAADLVKFALVRPGAVEAAAALDSARGFVRQTIPATAPGGPAPVDPAAERVPAEARS
jgi:hypothetical protein